MSAMRIVVVQMLNGQIKILREEKNPEAFIELEAVYMDKRGHTENCIMIERSKKDIDIYFD